MEEKKLEITEEVIKELEEKGYVIIDGDKYEFPDYSIPRMKTYNLHSPLAMMSEPYVITNTDHVPNDIKNAKTVQVRTEPKIYRNDPCNCGSGIKYKKCCGR